MGGGKKPQPAVSYIPPELIQNRAQERNTQQVLSQQAIQAQNGSGTNRGGTLLTGSQGLSTPAPIAKKQLLGQ